jgi:hypothetical protein
MNPTVAKNAGIASDSASTQPLTTALPVALASALHNRTGPSDLAAVHARLVGVSLAAATARIRAEPDHDKRNGLKRNLPAVIVAGLFAARRTDAWARASGLLVCDIDKVADLDGVRTRMAADPHVALCFTSPSGTGVKAVLRVPVDRPDPALHARAFAAAERWAREVHGVKLDPSGKDPARLCYLGHDPDAVLRLDAAPLDLDLDRWAPEASESNEGDDTPESSDGLAPITTDRHQWLIRLAGRLVQAGIASREALIAAAQKEWPARVKGRDPQPNEIENAIDSAIAKGFAPVPPPELREADEGELMAITRGMPIEGIERTQATTIAAALAEVAHVAVDAVGGLRDPSTDSMIATTAGDMIRQATLRARAAGVPETSQGRVAEIVEQVLEHRSAKRRRNIIATLVGHPADAEGDVELRRWIMAVVGRVRTPDRHAMRHFLWNVKRKMIGLPAEAHLCPVVTGVQGCGKSVAVARLCEPLRELCDPKLEILALTDDRTRPMLARKYVFILDEMAGAGRADMNELKSLVTAAHVSFRPMRTNTWSTIPNNASFIGTSNDPLREIVRDATGSRRFYELKAQQRIDWAEINGIDYNLIWRAVDEREPAPGVLHRDIIKAEQKTGEYVPPARRWMADEDWTGGSFDAGQGRVAMLAAVEPGAWVATADLVDRFRAWCSGEGERLPDRIADVLARELAHQGWEPGRSRQGGGRARGWTRPAEEAPL